MVAALCSLWGCSVFGSWGLQLFVCAASWLNHIKGKTNTRWIQEKLSVAEFTQAPEF